MDIMKERIQDIQAIYNNTMAIKQISNILNKLEYREKLRQLQESDILNSLYQFRKLTQTDLAQFQDGAKCIFKVIAPGFETHFTEITLTSTSKVLIELYQHFGFAGKSEQLYNELLHNSKQQIFLCLIQHLIELTKIAMRCAIKRFLDLKLFCVGKEMEKTPILITKRFDLIQESTVKRLRMKRVQHSESNHFSEQLSNIIDDRKNKFSINELIVHCDKSEIIKKAIVDDPIELNYAQSVISQNNKEFTQFRSHSLHKSYEPQKIQLPSIQKPSPSNLFKILKQRNQIIQQHIDSYLKVLYDKGIIEE